jgi:hypothetical protein
MRFDRGRQTGHAAGTGGGGGEEGHSSSREGPKKSIGQLNLDLISLIRLDPRDNSALEHLVDGRPSLLPSAVLQK